MKVAIKPANEQSRLRRLKYYELLDTPPDPCLNDFVQIASMICSTPIALISLVDEDRQWFKAKCGLKAQETPRDFAFCSHAILQEQVFVVEDALLDERFFDNPLVTGDPKVRFYAGAPLKAPDGEKIGTLCVIDHVKRELTSEQRHALQALSRQIMNHLALVQANRKQLELETELRRSQSQIERANHRLELAELLGRFGSWDLDLDSREVNYSAGFFKILCIEQRESLLFEDFLSVIHPDDHPVVRELSQSLHSGQTQNFEIYYRVLGIDGHEKHVRSTGKVVGRKIFGTLLDVTQMKELEQSLLKQKELALSSSRSKSRFLANMSHEIRTPLNGIIGLSKLLSEELVSISEKQQLSTIIGCAETLQEIIIDILDFSKLEAGTVELSCENFEVNQLISSVVATLGYRTASGEVKLKWKAQDDLNVFGDPLRIKQIILNLLSNALKFTEKGEVSISLLVVNSTEERVNFQIIVRDTGIGIDEEGVKKLFKPFSQVDNSSSRRFGGTGLGLAITRDLVTMMGGVISVTSTQGEGSTFIVSLGLKRAPKINIPIEKPRDLSGHPFPLRILIAEDVETNVLVVQGFLIKLGYRPKAVRNGQEVLAELEKNKYDLILMDCHMPTMDGFEATRLIRENRETDRIRIIALSAGTTEEEKLMSQEAGMDGFLSKPLSFDDLERCLRATFEISRETFCED